MFGFQAKSADDCPKYPGPYIPTAANPIPWPESYNYSTNLTFPEDFKWGLGSAAYMVEGAYNKEGRGATIWDTYVGANTRGMPGANKTNCPGEMGSDAPCIINPGMASGGNTGDVAINQYNDLDNHIGLMNKTNMSNYRFSISWARICPTGDCKEQIH